MAIWLGGKRIEAKRVYRPDGTIETIGKGKIVNDKAKLALCLLLLAWTFFNCIKPPYEGTQLIPAVRRGGFYENTVTISPAHYTTVPAGRWFVWNLPDLIVGEGKQPVKITRINAASLVTEYAAGAAVIGAAWLVVDWARRNREQ